MLQDRHTRSTHGTKPERPETGEAEGGVVAVAGLTGEELLT